MMDYRHSSYVNGTSYGLLESSLRDILSVIKPVEEDRVKRLNTINDVRNAIQSVSSLKGATVNPFGSFISNLYTKWGDLDISIQVSTSPYSSISRKQKQRVLRDVMIALRRTGWDRMNFIPRARVPLLVYECSSRNISCDISIDNYVGQIKSKIFLRITEVDGRFRDMVLLVKEWAKVHNINDPKAGTLNSYSLCLLVIFHFQTCSPAILPPLKDIYDGNLVNVFSGRSFVSERQIEDLCASNIAKFRSQGGKNNSTLHELLTSFFQKFSRMRDLARDNAICTYSAKWESIHKEHDWLGKSYKLIVEDPFEQPENAARAVGETGLTMISDAFAETYRNLSSSGVLSDRNALLRILARQHVVPHVVPQVVPHVVPHVGTPRFHHAPGGTRGGHENRVAVNYAATRSPCVQTHVAASASGELPGSQFHNARVQTHVAASGELPRSQFHSAWPPSSSTSSQRHHGPREMQSRTMWVPRYT